MSLFHDVFFPRDMFAEVDGLVRRMDAMSHAASRGLDGRHGLTHGAAHLVPQVAVDEREDAFVLTADVPGLTADALSVTFEDGTLTVRGQVAAPGDDSTDVVHDDDGWRMVRGERRGTRFERALRFRTAVDGEGVTAALTDGVLRIEVPKRHPTTVSIPVSST